MLSLVLSLCVALFDFFLPTGAGQMWAAYRSPLDWAKLVEGRARLCLVRRGMTEAEVKAVLGPPSFRECSGSLQNRSWVYQEFGVEVSLSRGEGVRSFGTLRIARHWPGEMAPRVPKIGGRPGRTGDLPPATRPARRTAAQGDRAKAPPQLRCKEGGH